MHDGDTVRLADGRAVRVIGIDTPELARDGRPDEPLARVARDRLRALVRGAGMRLGLRYDAEREDRYGRLLTHAYLPDGRSVAAVLLAEGLASQLVVPPNVASWKCYRAAEREARASRRGLWALAGWMVQPSIDLDAARRGLALVRGRVVAIEPRRSGVRVLLEGGLVAWVPGRALPRFGNLEALSGRHVEVRGRLRGYRGEQQVTVRHPFALTLIGTDMTN